MRELILCSGSQSRSALLRDCGLHFRVHTPAIDDSLLPHRGLGGADFTVSLAWFKMAQSLTALTGVADGTILLAADTTCLIRGRNEGKPVDESDAARMLSAMNDAAHDVVTGVALTVVGSPRRWLLADKAIVHLGSLTKTQTSEYLSSGSWMGRAGGYNYSERLAAGWPLRCEGDPTTVVGLPMRRLLPWLQAALGCSGEIKQEIAA